MFDLRLIGADALKLGRRYGMLAISLFLTVGVAAIVYSVTAIQHLSNASKYGPAGGLHNYQDSIAFLGVMTFIVAAIVGSTAGSQDIETGVFRDLAATGRNRIALFGSRITGALVVVLPIVALTAVFTAGLSIALAGSLAAPSAGAIISGTLALVASATLGCAVAVGLAALVGSRGPVIAMLLAFELAISPLLSSIGFLGVVRQIIPSNALDRIANAPHLSVPMALGTSIIVLLAWAGAAFAAGAWRTRTQEI
jgi:ABC-type transport system involved in multi-copper enzyme maturation permease subunit